jgi:hypothetical protein
MNEDTFDVIWRAAAVGKFINPMPDMWYLEGRFEANDTTLAEAFVERATRIDLNGAMRDPKLGSRLVLRSVNGADIHVGLINLNAGTLFVRCYYGNEAKAWLWKEVAE